MKLADWSIQPINEHQNGDLGDHGDGDGASRGRGVTISKFVFESSSIY
jgi:hypothetical protein